VTLTCDTTQKPTESGCGEISGYILLDQQACAGRNELGAFTKTAADCAASCSENEECISFEIDTNSSDDNCRLSSSCKAEFTMSWDDQCVYEKINESLSEEYISKVEAEQHVGGPSDNDWSNQFATCATYNGNSCSGCLKPCAKQPERLCCYNTVKEEDCKCLENHKWCGVVTDVTLCADDWSNQFATCTTYNGNSCSKCLKPCANQPERLCCYNPVEEADCSCLENHKWCGDVTLTCSTTQKPTDGNEVNIDNFGETTNAHSSVMSTTYSSHVWDMIVGYPGETLSVNLVYMQVGTGGSIDGIWTIGTSYTATSVSGIQCSEIETTSEIVNGHAGYNWLKCDFQGQSITVPSDGVLYSKIQITGGSNQREDTGSQAHTSFHYQNGGFRAGFTSFYFTSINLGGYVDVPSCEWHEMNNMNKVIQTEQFFGFECPANQIISHIRLQGYDENSHLENNPRAILCCGLRGSSEVTDRCEDSYSTADGILEAATCEGNNAMVALYDLADPTLQELQWEYQATKGITCCDIEYNTDYGHTLDLGIDRNQCEIVSHSSPVGIFDVACPDDMVLVEIRDNDPARGVQEVHEIECCRVHNALAPTHAPTISPSTSEPSPAPTTSCHDCLIGVHGRQVSAQDAFVSEVEACLSHCCA